eukprot:CAMPEP_0175506610 /NCGR_PEP_ID=MMETSP0096-20121207/9438_1 /TAXON_ID=311494 /ORGANISM="Alexandrium monilatum, Strain CCMP3105" /LENGTH=67 /DNA_ID=CAMNT_0016808713 /DNA_START=80 /DNA_END=279 /DNA_ORIENTATION=-
MPRSACLVLAALLGLYAAACFVAPSGPRGLSAGAANTPASVADSVQAPGAAPADSAAWSPLAVGLAL